MYFDWFLVRGITLPAAQLSVIAIRDILRGVCGQSNKILDAKYDTFDIKKVLLKQNHLDANQKQDLKELFQKYEKKN